jgi:hypothetical protein
VEKNAKEIKDHIEELYWGTGNKVVLLGHSKGGVDAATACSMFWFELKDKVVGLVLVQSPYGGSPIASDILHEGQIADDPAHNGGANLQNHQGIVDLSIFMGSESSSLLSLQSECIRGLGQKQFCVVA